MKITVTKSVCLFEEQSKVSIKVIKLNEEILLEQDNSLKG